MKMEIKILPPPTLILDHRNIVIFSKSETPYLKKLFSEKNDFKGTVRPD